MTVTFAVMMTLKVGAMLGTGLMTVIGIQSFQDYKYQKDSKKGGEKSDVGESLREKSRQIG